MTDTSTEETTTSGRTLRTSVNVYSEEHGFISYPEGMPEELMRPGDADLITNPKAWVDPDAEEDEGLSAEVLAAAAATAELRLEYTETAADEGDGIEDDFSEMTVPELREYADANGIDLEGATKKADILKVLRSNVD